MGGRSSACPALDLPGALLLTACPLLFAFGVVEAGGPGTPPWVVPAALAGAVAAWRVPAPAPARAPAPAPVAASTPSPAAGTDRRGKTG
ncbi:hypothetical protein [Streptomyces sp. NPDC006267]|uniref:hypothetical protein n=1 Tax=Streptomyces sp. NPDC006267 TaxID=3157173 RepID=UPI00339E1F32